MSRPWIFEFGAFLYGVMTSQPTWKSSCARLLDYFPARRPQALRVLDLGCGPGVSTIVIATGRPDAMVVGLDLAGRMLEQARSYTAKANLERQVSYVHADAARLPFARESLDMITGHSFLYLVPDSARVVAEAYRVLRHGGTMASMEPHGGRVDWMALARRWRKVRYVVSVVFWRPYSRLHGQMTQSSFTELYRRLGFANIRTEVVLDGFGIIGSADKP